MIVWAIFYGVFTLAILYSQYRLQRLNFRLMLYDKRYAVFLSVMQYISSVLQNARADNDELMKLMRNSKDKEFLFGFEVGDYVQALYSKGIELNKVNYILASQHDRSIREKLVEQTTTLFEWFENQFEEAKRIFKYYLAITCK